jgi:hypothetical protein
MFKGRGRRRGRGVVKQWQRRKKERRRIRKQSKKIY